MSSNSAMLFSRLDRVDEHIVWGGLGELYVFARRSPAKSTDNEDGALVLRLNATQGVVAVADGVGGHPAGEQASADALECLRDIVVEGVSAGESLRGAILAGIDRANQAVLALGAGSATTLAAITVDGARVRAYHVGDSGILVFGGRGKRRLETIAHSPVGYGVEAGLIDVDEALEHEERHIVSNVVGDADMHIGVSSPIDLRAQDRVVLASDGLFDNMSVEEVVEAVRRGPLERSVAELGRRCGERMLAGGHPDDLTVVTFRPRTK